MRPCRRRKDKSCCRPRCTPTASPRRGGLADRRAPSTGELLPLKPSRRHGAQATRRSHQGTQDMRTGASATEGRARPPLRRTIMDRPAPARADDDDRLRLPPVPAPQAGQRAEKDSSDRHPSPACPRSNRPSSPPSRCRRRHDVLTAANLYELKNCQGIASLAAAWRSP